jgi:hypothetical protein
VCSSYLKYKDHQATASSDRQRVLQRFIDGSQYALDEFKQMQKNAKCIIDIKGSSTTVTGQTTTNETGLNSTTWALIIGSSVLLFGFVGFLIYKKYKK